MEKGEKYMLQNDEMAGVIFFCFGIAIFGCLLFISLKGFFVSWKKRKIQEMLLKNQNMQVYCTKQMKLNGKKYYICRDSKLPKEYLVNSKGEIRGFKRIFY